MANSDRRSFLGWAGSAAGLSFSSGLIGRALAIPANRRTGSIRDVEHIVIHMQENRSFDQYFGAFNGVRGFGDPRPLRLPNGNPVWMQPSEEHPDGHVMPYHGDSRLTRSYTVGGGDQNHQADLTIFNRGRFDRWGQTREMKQRMLHYSAADLPFYYALADAFTICDAYHCSTLTQTYPNRMHLFTGCNGGGGVGGDPMMDNYGEDETPSADMAEDRPLDPAAYRWTTYAERLQAAGISWKVYQEYDNFGDNLLSVFPPFRPCEKDSPLYRRGRSWVSEHKDGPDRTRSDGEQLVEAFRADLAAGTLPQVSWIVTSAALSEHPRAIPAAGEHVTAKLVEALVDHPEMFAKTVMILTYDEVGGFFDHMPPPVPPVAPDRGFSTVPVAGEIKDYGDKPVANPGSQPIGLGLRVPTVLVSPWSRGGYVCSEVFDHTSVIRFVEQRFGVREPNISAWRRAVCGDLTSAFDFAAGADDRRPALPSTADFQHRIGLSAGGSAIAIPTTQTLPRQMAGRRPARPVAYDFSVEDSVTPNGRFALRFVNPGRLGVVLAVYEHGEGDGVWHFTIGAGATHIAMPWHDGRHLNGYDLTVRGPNGFQRRYAGSLRSDHDRIDARLILSGGQGPVLSLANGGQRSASFRIDDALGSIRGVKSAYSLGAGQTLALPVDLAARDGWYDLQVSADAPSSFVRHFAGGHRNRRTEPMLQDAERRRLADQQT